LDGVVVAARRFLNSDAPIATGRTARIEPSVIEVAAFSPVASP
jgi:hypothetical protein